MKKIFVFLGLILITFCAKAHVTLAFQGWDRLEEESPDIVVVYTRNQTAPGTTPLIGDAMASDWQVKILSVLKGTNTISSTRFSTDYELRNNRTYLVFGYHDNIGLVAVENYRVIPLGNGVPLDSLKDKSLDEKLQILLKIGLQQVNQKIQEDEEAKERLEQALQK